MKHTKHNRTRRNHRCALCGLQLATQLGMPSFDAACPDCGYFPWCTKRVVGEDAILLVLPGRIPNDRAVQRLADSLIHDGSVGRVVVDLSLLDTICSSMLARLIGLNRRVRPHKGRAAVCRLSTIVREIFCRTRIDTLFDVLECDDDSASCRNPVLGPGLTQTAAIWVA